MTTTATLLYNVIVRAVEIASGDPYSHRDSYISVDKVFWSDDDQVVYYAFVPTTTNDLKWATYDISTRVTTIISSPLKYDSRVWQRLGVADPRESFGYPELLGYISPSGKHVIYTVAYGGNPMDNPSAGVEVWVANSRGSPKTKLAFKARMGIIHEAAWFKDESKVIFSFGYEGFPRVYVADIPSGKVMSLKDISGFEGLENTWALSPDEKVLAITSAGVNELWLISLENWKSKVVKDFGRCLQWSKDGRTLYHLWSLSNETYVFRSYDVVSGNISTIFSQSDRADAFAPVPSCDFAFSSRGDKVLVQGKGLWLLELHR